MPISNFTQLRRFSETCGAEIPRWIGKRMQAYGDDANGMREFGADIVARLCERLIAGGAPSLHFYTLNLANPTQAVLSRLACTAAARLPRATSGRRPAAHVGGTALPPPLPFPFSRLEAAA